MTPSSRLVYPFFPSISRPLPDDALGSELTVELRVEAVTALIDLQALAALLAKPCFVLLTDPNRFPIRVALASHLLSLLNNLKRPIPIWSKEI